MKQFFAILASWGPWGLLGLSTVESLGIPNPGGTDIALIALAAAEPDKALLCAALATLGSFLGTAIFYELTRKGGEAFLTKYTSRGGGARFCAWYQHYGLLTVFIAALVPLPILPFKLFAACSGAFGVSRKKFFAILGLGRIPRYAALAYLGTKLGPDSWPWVRRHTWHLIVISLLLFIVLYGFVRWTDRSRLARHTAAG